MSTTSNAPILTGGNLMNASREWATRPADQRFSSLEALNAACLEHRRNAREARSVPYSTLSVSASDAGAVLVTGSSGRPAQLNHFSFGQFASRVGAPAGYLRKLPAPLAVECLREGLTQLPPDASAKLLLSAPEGAPLAIRAFTSDDYTRIWNADVTRRLLRLTQDHPEWQPAPAAFDGSRGLYASDANMFAFLVDNNRRIFEQDPGGGLSRGFFVANSEVGDCAFYITTFLYAYVCGNHIVWGAQQVRQLRIRHVGTADDRAFAGIAAELRAYSNESASTDEARITRARAFQIGASKDEVLDAVFALRAPQLSRKMISDGFDRAEAHVDWYGSPRTAWGLANGLTEIARDAEFADARVDLERASGKVLAMAF